MLYVNGFAVEGVLTRDTGALAWDEGCEMFIIP